MTIFDTIESVLLIKLISMNLNRQIYTHLYIIFSTDLTHCCVSLQRMQLRQLIGQRLINMSNTFPDGTCKCQLMDLTRYHSWIKLYVSIRFTVNNKLVLIFSQKIRKDFCNSGVTLMSTNSAVKVIRYLQFFRGYLYRVCVHESLWDSAFANFEVRQKKIVIGTLVQLV